MSALVIALISAVGGGGVVGAILTYFNRRVENDIRRDEVRTADWAKITDYYSRQIEDMAKSFGKLEARLSRVESELDSERKRFNAAIGYIRLLMRWISERYPGSDLPDVPDVLRNDV